MIKFFAINESFLNKPHDTDICNKVSQTYEDKGQSSEIVSKEKEEFRIKKLYEQALELQMSSKYNELINALEEILLSSIMKDNLEISSHMKVVKAATFKLLANTHRKLKNYDESYVFYQIAIKMNVQDLNLWHGFALTCENLCHWNEALTSYEHVLRINNGHWPSLDSLIIITFSLLEFERCADCCQQALYLDRKYEAAIYILQKIFTYQPSLKSSMGIFLEEMPDVLTTVVDEHVANQLFNKISLIMSDINKKRNAAESADKISTIVLKVRPVNWEVLTQTVLRTFLNLMDEDRLESMVEIRNMIPEELPRPIAVVSATTSVCLPAASSDDADSLSDGCTGRKSGTRITRNSSQLVETPEPKEGDLGHYYGCLIRRNILNEVHAAAGERFKEYSDLAMSMKEPCQPIVETDIGNCGSGVAAIRNIGDDRSGVLSSLVATFNGRKMTIIEIARDIVECLAGRSDFRWSSYLVDDFLALSGLVRTHVSCQREETPVEALAAVKRLLFEAECLVDRRQSDLEGKLQRNDRAFKLSDFVPQRAVDEFSDRIMRLEIEHGREMEAELTLVQIRVLWLSYILAEMSRDEAEVCLQLNFLRRCLSDRDIPSYIRPNCIHHSAITIKKVDDYLSASSKCLKIDVLRNMYRHEQYDEIIAKTNSIIGSVTLPKDDYAEEMNNYLVQISFHGCSYHKVLTRLMEQHESVTEDRDRLIKVYSDIVAALEEVTNVVEVLNDPKKKRTFSPVSDRQKKFLTDNYFKVVRIILTNASSFLKMLESNGLGLIDVLGVGEVARFVVLAKEYFYHAFLNNMQNIDVAHIWCLYSHFKSLELHDPVRYNQSVTYNPVEELDLPPSLNFLSLTHDYLGLKNCCAQADGALLKLVLASVSEYIEEVRPRYRKQGVFLANHSDVLSLLDQALYCVRPVQRPDIDRTRKPLEHGCTERVTISLPLAHLLLSYLEPDRLPEVDSIKSLSVSADLNALFLEIISVLPESVFSAACSEQTVRMAIESEEPLNFPTIPRSRYTQLFYFVADHYFKNNEFEKALEYYIKNLRFTPICFDSWAGIALIYYKRLEDKFNMMDNNSESLSQDEVSHCLNSFNHAIALDSENLTIVVEKGCFCYEVHSYASRILKKSLTRDIDPSLVSSCEVWSRVMLENAKDCYEMAMETDMYRGEREEKWLYFYMLAKCMEKSGENSIMDVLDSLEKSMEALESSGAKYVRKIVFYTKIPYRAVEAVEVYYKYHASILKFLLRNQSTLLSDANSKAKLSSSVSSERSKKVDHATLLEIQQRLIAMTQSSFIVNVGKIKAARTGGGKKRTATRLEEGPEATKVARLSPQREHPVDVIDMTNIPPELRYDDADDDCIIEEVVLPSQAEDPKSVYERCVDLCRTAMEVVLQRLPLHYKAIYHLAYIHSYVPHLKNLEKSYDYLMGSCKTGKSTINGLFKDRKTCNFFSGIWRIPVSDIDRNGSFAHHMYRSMNLLMTVLRQLNAWKDLSSINTILRKSGSERRGFLSNGDRQMLVRKSMGHSFYSVKEWLVGHRGDIGKEDLVLVQGLFLVAVKQSQGIEKMRAVFQEAFSRCGVAMEMYAHLQTAAGEPVGGDLNMGTVDKVMAGFRDPKK